jgi:TrmH family RNA methyltransferase
MKELSDLKSTPRMIGVSKYIDKNDLGKRIVILDDVQDPGNIGTIVRNSVAFDIDTLVLSKKCANVYSPKVLRSTGGMIYNINIIIDELENVVDKIKKSNIRLIGTSLEKSKSLEEIDKLESYAVIFGNEGNGVSKDLLNKCDDIVRIDMNNMCESLNVGVSSGIFLYHMFKR